MMSKDFQEVERSKIKKSEKMMRKDVSGGWEVQVQQYEKNEKRRFTRWRGPSSKNSKMMRKDVSGGQRSKFKK
jgi:hypothetical protein